MAKRTKAKKLPLDKLLEKRVAARLSPLSEETQTHYGRCIRKYGEFLGRIPTTADLEVDQLLDWCESIVESGRSPVTANANLKQLKALWSWGSAEGLIDSLPPRRFNIPEERPVPDSWTGHELEKLFACADKVTGYVGPHHANNWTRALLWVAWNTGERAGALRRLTPSMFDLDTATLTVPASIRKAERIPMRWRLSERCVAALEPVLAQARGSVFGEGVTSNSAFGGRFQKVIDLAGVERDDKYGHRRQKLQKIRRTVASFIKQRGGDPSVWLGHAPRSVAEEHYIDRWSVQQLQSHVWPLDGFDVRQGLPSVERLAKGRPQKRRRYVARRY